MLKISASEFENNFGKYVEIALKEGVVLTKHKKPFLTLLPQQVELIMEWKSLIGTLPKNATIGEDPNERD